MSSERELNRMVVRFLFVVAESILLWSFLRALPVVCAGNIAGIAASSVLIIFTMFFDKSSSAVKSMWGKDGGRAFLIISGTVLLLIIIYCIVMSVFMAKAINDGEDKKADAVIVLGCQIRDDRPSKMLKHRLDKAYEYLKNDPDCICIVSGGKGSDEKYAEAEIMKKYLTESGIEGSRIITEDKSTTTKENMRFSKAILDDMGITGNVCFVSDGYHLFRAGLIAKDEGLDAFGLAAETELRFLPTYWVREWLSIGYYFVTK